MAKLEIDHRFRDASSTNLTMKMKGPATRLEVQQLRTMTDKMNWHITYITPLNQWRKNTLMRFRLSALSQGNMTEMLTIRATSRRNVAS